MEKEFALVGGLIHNVLTKEQRVVIVTTFPVRLQVVPLLLSQRVGKAFTSGSNYQKHTAKGVYTSLYSEMEKWKQIERGVKLPLTGSPISLHFPGRFHGPLQTKLQYRNHKQIPAQMASLFNHHYIIQSVFTNEIKIF